MQKQRIILIAGIVLGLIAVFMANTYISQQRHKVIEEANRKVQSIKTELETNQAPVLVAKEDIPAGAMIDPNKLEVKIVPKQYLQPQAATSLDRIAGMLTLTTISKGEQITLSKLSFKQAAGGGGLAGLTPVGKRAVTISVDNLASLAGMLKPGDYVDVIAMVPIPVQAPGSKQMTTQAAVVPLFQNVLVLAVGQQTGAAPVASEAGGRYAAPAPKEASPLITLALSPQEASLIAFVEEQGKIRLVLRSPADSQTQSIQPTSWESLLQYIMPQTGTKVEEPAKEVSPEERPSVEIIRGMNKEKIFMQ